MNDVREAYNNVYRMLMRINRRASISAQFVSNRVVNFSTLLRKNDKWNENQANEEF